MKNENMNDSWDFKNEDTLYSTHKFHSYPAKFIPQIPKRTIELFLSKEDTNDVILDPFCGSGTTCVEARLAHKNAIGIDLNPLAVLISKSKSTPIEPSIIMSSTKILKKNTDRAFLKSNSTLMKHFSNGEKEFPEHLLGSGEIIGDYKEKSKEYLRYVTEGIKEVKIQHKFFLPLKIIFHEIKRREYENNVNNNIIEVLYNYFLVALSSTINTLSKNGRIKGDKYYPIKIFDNHLKNMNAGMLEFYNDCDKRNYSKINEGNSWDLSKFADDNCVDLIVTSPPYANAFDYHREHKLNILWLGLEYRKFKDQEIGAHSLFTGNRFRMLTEYLSDMFSSISEMCRVLKQNKTACIVIGNSTIEHVIIKTNNYFKEFGDILGFKLQEEFLRNIDTTKKYTSKGIGNIENEYVILLKKNSYLEPKKELIVETVKNILERILEQHRKNNPMFDENTFTKTLQRKKELNIREMKNIIIDSNIKKLEDAILNVKKDCFVYR